jgi:hypothetical protein
MTKCNRTNEIKTEANPININGTRLDDKHTNINKKRADVKPININGIAWHGKRS